MNKFAPLTADELAATPLVTPPMQHDGELVSPIPPDAPAAPAGISNTGTPTSVWEYPDANGGLAFEVIASIRRTASSSAALTLWRTAWLARMALEVVPAPRPLYNLDKLAASPEAPVVFCEGEKAADGAASVFPRSVCITSPGGSQSASKADWSKLAGRRVLIWPDADEPGAKYAQEVAAILHSLGCEVSITDAMALAARTPMA